MADLDPNDAIRQYRTGVMDAARHHLGRELPTGTVVVGAADRTGSTVAVAYPLGDRTIVWCAPDVVERYAPLVGPEPLSHDGFVEATRILGGTFVGAGNHRVLRRAPRVGHIDGFQLVHLDRDEPDARALLSDFVDACPVDDLDEAELSMDELDPSIVALVDDDGAIASCASGRPWAIADEFDDIAVITHPGHRGRGLGSAVVGGFATVRHTAGRRLFYSCDVDNARSNGVAERVGFELACSVVAVTID